MANTNKRPHLIARLKGGLGNQMFQYAASRALSLRNNMELILDTNSGFIRDKVYRRTFQLDRFPLHVKNARILEFMPFWLERGIEKIGFRGCNPINNRPWGKSIFETETKFLDDVANIGLDRHTWIEGYWQSEKYFEDYSGVIISELTPHEVVEPIFVSMAKLIRSCTAVAVGVRIFEEIQDVDKAGVGGMTPLSFYEKASDQISCEIKEPIFFVFCTKLSAVNKRLRLPGPIHYLTTDNGFNDPVQTLWLLNHFRYHIISNSSFFWWGAWLSEHHNAGTIVIPSDLFVNSDTVPSRWKGKRH